MDRTLASQSVSSRAARSAAEGRASIAALALALLAGCGGPTVRPPANARRFVGATKPSKLALRLDEELEASRIRAVVAEGYGLPDTELARLARQRGFEAGVVVDAKHRGGARFATLVFARDGSVSRHVIVQGAAETSAEVVLRVVEALRAELMPLPDFVYADAGSKEATTQPASAPAKSARGKGKPTSRPASTRRSARTAPAQARSTLAVARAPRREEAPRFAIGVSGGVSYGPVAIDPFAQIGLALAWRFTPRWEACVRVFAPVSSSVVSAAGGSSRLYPAAARLGARWRPLARRFRADFYLGASAGAALLVARGEPVSQLLRAQDETIVAADVGASLGLTIAIHGPFSVYLDALTSFWIPRAQVMIDDEIAGALGRPLVHLALGVEAAF